MKGCISFVNRLDKHLKKKHGLECANPDYKKYVRLGSLPKYEIAQCSSWSDEALSDKMSDDDSYEPSTDADISSDSDENTEYNHDNEFVMSTVVGEMAAELEEFRVWLIGLGGGWKLPSNAKQTVKRVIKVLETFGTNFSKENVSLGLNNLENDLIPKMLDDGKQASTVKVYLLDFQRFCTKYAMIKDKSWMPKHASDRIEAQIKMWSRALDKKISRRAQETKLRDRKKAVTPEDIKKYMNGPRAQSGKDVLDRPTPANEINLHEHTMARNYLIMKLVLWNATRAGPIINMSIQDVYDAKENVFHNKHVINVQNHKTSRAYGSAQLTIYPSDYTRLVNYIENLRPKHNREVDNAFVTWPCKSMPHSILGQIITIELAVSGDGGESGDLRKSCTLMRKSIVALVKQLELGAENDKSLARLMKHSDRMQNMTYDTSRSDKSMSKMSEVVRRVWEGEDITADDLRDAARHTKVDEFNVTKSIPQVSDK